MVPHKHAKVQLLKDESPCVPTHLFMLELLHHSFLFAPVECAAG